MDIEQVTAEARILRNKLQYPTPFPKVTWWQKLKRWFKR